MPSGPIATGFTVYFIDVGQGDATLIVAPAGESLLIDGGRSKARIRERLNALGITDLDAVLATHADADHIAGLVEVFGLYDVERFYWNGQGSDTLTFQNLMAAVQAEGAQSITSSRGDTIALGDLIFSVLHPSALTGDSNVDSLVLALTCGNVKLLFLGDAEVSSEQDMAAAGVLSNIDILKVGHHGSRSSTSDDFVAAVEPEVGLISAGLNNQYGHPHPEVVERLTAAGVELWYTDITDQADTVTLVSDCQTFSLRQPTPAGAEATITPTPTTEPSGAATPTPVPSVVSSVELGTVFVTEMMPNPAAVSDAAGEWFEIFNSSLDVDVNLNGWTIRDLGSNVHVINSGGPLVLPAQGYVVLGRNADATVNGGVTVDYQYSGFTLVNSGDEIELIDSAGKVIDTVVYTSSQVFNGASASLDPALFGADANDQPANWCPATSLIPGGDKGTPGAANDPCP